MAPWMLDGGRAAATVAKVESDDVASWRRLIVEIRCYADGGGVTSEE